MSAEELEKVLLDVLERNGELGRIKSQLRSSIYESLAEGPRASHQINNSETARIIYSLIKEFLRWNSLNRTRNILDTEASLEPESLPDRTQILEYLQITDSEQSKQLPLLVGIIDHFKNQMDNSQ